MSKIATAKKSPSGTTVVQDTRSEKSLTVGSVHRNAVTIHRDTKTGSFTSQRSAARIRDTSMRAADSLKRLAKR